MYLFSDQEVIIGEMEVFTSKNEDNSDLMKDVSDDVSLDPLVLISNLNKRFREEDITWKYDNKPQHISIKTSKRGYILQIPVPLGNLLGLQNSDVGLVNAMTSSHAFKSTGLYKRFWTEKFIEVTKLQNNLSIYEL